MRASLKILVAAAATLLVAPQLATADDVEAQLRAMNERMARLKSQLEATGEELQASQETVEAQQDLMEQAGLERQAQSGLSAFLSQTQFDGHVAVSWNWNFNNPDDTAVNARSGDRGGNSAFNSFADYRGTNVGQLRLTTPHHTNHNSIQVDQFFLSMMKPATAESRGGFGVDLVFGDNALERTKQFNVGSHTGKTIDRFALYQGYVEYLAPVLNGIDIKFGRFEGLVGAESYRSDQNWQVTRGLLWTLQPVNHDGLLVGGECECGFVWALGGVNGYWQGSFDTDNEKSLIGRVGYKTEMFSFMVNGFWGGDASDFFGSDIDGNGIAQGPGTSDDEVGLIDAVLRVDPLENLSMWVNFDYYWTADADFGGSGPLSSITVYGVAAAARLGVTERMGVALRYEWLYGNDLPPVFFTPNPEDVFLRGSGSPDLTAQSITGTIDYALTDHLTVKLEGRYDWFSMQGTPDNFFTASSTRRQGGDFDPAAFTKEDQALALVQVMYEF